MSYLLDTNVISELRKGERADANVRAWFSELADEEIFLSVLTIGEVRRGVENVRLRDPKAAAALDSWLARLGEAHRKRILPVDRAVAEEWGRMNVPDPLPVVDGLLAATAKVIGLTFATRNVADVKGSGVELLNPFST
ncbi:MAG TPA: type II toxin-antitoxin system VapC family toxin, partial [Solirubrobacterales bacterium]|nr:type II toxin-antitoxin system VapC family toxin [Solirubrobacterales bacterium]